MKKSILFFLGFILIISLIIFIFIKSDGDESKSEDTLYKGIKEEWLTDAFDTIIIDEDIKAISYWNENWEDEKPVNMVINSSEQVLVLYRANIANDVFKSELNVIDGKVLALESGIYHAAYPGFSEENGTKEVVTSEKINSFEEYAQKDIAWVYFSNSWDNGIKFPKEEVNIIDQEGKTPFIRMMPWSVIAPHLQQSDPEFSMQRFIDADFDDELKLWAQELIEFQKPVIIEFGTEVNGDWMPWNGRWNGAGEYSYGDPTVPDGPERFRDAYRHMIDLFEEEGVHNATWVFHVNYSSTPDEEWNSMKYYYPGDEYIDWLGVSIYGPLYEGHEWAYSFGDVWEYTKPKLHEISSEKPIAILEFGAGND